jgi:hypothetical protein
MNLSEAPIPNHHPRDGHGYSDLVLPPDNRPPDVNLNQSRSPLSLIRF